MSEQPGRRAPALLLALAGCVLFETPDDDSATATSPATTTSQTTGPGGNVTNPTTADPTGNPGTDPTTGANGSSVTDPTTGSSVTDPTTADPTADPSGDPSWLALDGPVVTQVFTFDAFDLGDVDGDGRVDLVTSGTGFPPRLTVYPGRGDGSFDVDAAVTTDVFAFDAFVVADVDADGRADALTQGTGFPPRVTVYAGGPGFTEQATVEVFTFTHLYALDLDGDARAELLTGLGDGNPPQIHVWDPATGISVFDAAVLRYASLRGGDVDGDGRGDVVTAWPGFPPQVFVHPGDGAGGFAEPAVHEIFDFSRIDLGDLDGDGRSDLVTDVPGNAWRVQLYRSLADGYDAPLVLDLFNFGAFDLADLDGDGRADLVTQPTGEPPRVEAWLSRAP